MAEILDPYVEWLGIRETARPLSHYQLLGVPEFEENPLVIAVAADAAIARLNNCDSGNLRGRRQQLLDELALAKLCLADRTRKLQYDIQLRTRRGETRTEQSQSCAPEATPVVRPLAERSPPAGAPLNADLFPPNYRANVETRPVEVAPPIVALARVVAPPIAEPRVPSAPVAHFAQAPASPVYRGGPTVPPIVAPVGIAVATHPNDEATPVPLDVDAVGLASKRVRKTRSPDAWSLGIFAAAAVMAVLAFFLLRGEMHAPGETAQRTTPGSDVTGESLEDNLAVPEPRDPPPLEPAKDSRKSIPPPKPNSTPGVAAADEQPAPEVPPPAVTPQPPQSEQTPEQEATFEQAMKNARAAMAGRAIERAKQELQIAKTNTSTQLQEQQWVQLDSLYTYVEGFWKAVVDGMRELQATDTLAIDNSEIAIVEVGDNRLTIRAAGRNISYTLDNLPADLAVALASRWFDAKVPANKLFLGAFHAVDPKGDIDQARRLWQEATREGASAEHLLPLLNDRPGPLAEAQGPVPDKSVVAQARKSLRTTMAQQFRMAKSLERKRSLARELLTAADQNENDVERYVLFDEALHLAAGSGSAAEMNLAIDGIARSYQVDSWALRAKTFSEAAVAADNPVIAKALARAMLAVVDQAIASQRALEAEKLCAAALSAARKGKDLELVRQVRERMAKLKGE